ncbi:MAG: hypothetical protein V4653_10710 [Pseudomonadota bacterium]
MPATAERHRIVIVGGGAPLLELATRLGNRYRPAAKPASHWRSVHLPALHGCDPTLWRTLAGLISQRAEPGVKLH